MLLEKKTFKKDFPLRTIPSWSKVRVIGIFNPLVLL